jgi:hypothetical protein
MKKQTKRLKTLRVRKEALKFLTTEQQVRVNAGGSIDCWEPGFTATCDPGPITSAV